MLHRRALRIHPTLFLRHSLPKLRRLRLHSVEDRPSRYRGESCLGTRLLRRPLRLGERFAIARDALSRLRLSRGVLLRLLLATRALLVERRHARLHLAPRLRQRRRANRRLRRRLLLLGRAPRVQFLDARAKRGEFVVARLFPRRDVFARTFERRLRLGEAFGGVTRLVTRRLRLRGGVSFDVGEVRAREGERFGERRRLLVARDSRRRRVLLRAPRRLLRRRQRRLFVRDELGVFPGERLAFLSRLRRGAARGGDVFRERVQFRARGGGGFYVLRHLRLERHPRRRRRRLRLAKIVRLARLRRLALRSLRLHSLLRLGELHGRRHERLRGAPRRLGVIVSRASKLGFHHVHLRANRAKGLVGDGLVGGGEFARRRQIAPRGFELETKSRDVRVAVPRRGFAHARRALRLFLRVGDSRARLRFSRLRLRLAFLRLLLGDGGVAGTTLANLVRATFRILRATFRILGGFRDVLLDGLGVRANLRERLLRRIGVRLETTRRLANLGLARRRLSANLRREFGGAFGARRRRRFAARRRIFGARRRVSVAFRRRQVSLRVGGGALRRRRRRLGVRGASTSGVGGCPSGVDGCLSGVDGCLSGVGGRLFDGNGRGI